jgi:hypothetical protein
MAAGRIMEIQRNLQKNRYRKCLLCFGDEGVKPILLNWSETSKWRNEFLDKKWLDM